MDSFTASAEDKLYSANSLVFFALCLVQRLLLYMDCEVYGYGDFRTISISDNPAALLFSLF